MPGGRPSIKTPKLVEELLERMAQGEPLSKICADDHMPSFTTVWRWEEADEEFCKLSARALKHGTHHLAGQCLEIADDPSIETNDKKVRIDTRIRLIGKWNAKQYGDSTMLKHADADGDKLPPPPSDFEAAAKLSAIMAAVKQRSGIED